MLIRLLKLTCCIIPLNIYIRYESLNDTMFGCPKLLMCRSSVLFILVYINHSEPVLKYTNTMQNFNLDLFHKFKAKSLFSHKKATRMLVLEMHPYVEMNLHSNLSFSSSFLLPAAKGHHTPYFKSPQFIHRTHSHTDKFDWNEEIKEPQHKKILFPDHLFFI